MSNVKAALKVVLYAETVIVAESEDQQLWRRVLAAIQGESFGTEQAPVTQVRPSGHKDDENADRTPGAASQQGGDKGPVVKFAVDIGVEVAQLQGACDPTQSEPYLILDHDAWAAFKNQLGDRGPTAVSPVVAAATLLALWFKNSNGHANATQAQAQAVLKGLNVRDSNPARGVKRAEWLQPRPGGQIIINPSKMLKAKLFARCFCTQDWAAWKSGV